VSVDVLLSQSKLMVLLSCLNLTGFKKNFVQHRMTSGLSNEIPNN
jgi:hypothetical protein